MDQSQKDELASLYAERVAEHDRANPGYARKWDALSAAVLAHGGDLVVPPLEPEPRPVTIAEGLSVWDPDVVAVRHLAGQDNHCHGNSAELWLTGQADGIGTGYALNDDGLWRQHSWALAPDGAVIETTVGRDLYAGIILTGVELWRFALSNTHVDEIQLATERLRELPTIMLQLAALTAERDRSR